MRRHTFSVLILLAAIVAPAYVADLEPVAGDQPAGLTLYFYRDGQTVAVPRPGALSGHVAADAQTLIASLIAGPTDEQAAGGVVSALPAGARLAQVTVDGDMATVDLDLPPGSIDRLADPAVSDAAVDQIVKTLHPLGLNKVLVRVLDVAGEPVPLSELLPRPDVPVPTPPPNDEPLPPLSVDHAGQPPVAGQERPQGALTGKSVWLSAGHGSYWSETLQRWTTQRPNCYGVVEDLSNAEAVDYYLARYLWNAGADVWLVRDWGLSPHEVIVDNDGGAPGYVETGAWQTSASAGYGGGGYRWTTSVETGSAAATWTPELPEAGRYGVWVWYLHGDNRPVDVHYEVHHAGGVTGVRLSQEVHGATWRYLGEFQFDAGMMGHVTLLNDSTDPGQAVIADAVRFGSGAGTIGAPGGTSGRPRWEEAASYWAQYQGAPPDVYGSDVTARPLYAEWETAKGQPGEAADAVYISWHTNAGGGTGTDSFVHVSEPTPGSLALQDWVHAELVADLRAAWDPGWVDRGQKSADFGELRELSTMPGVLLEVAFHDTEDPGDADDLREPLFRQIAARAVYQGIVKYHAARQGTSLQLLPEPPQRLAARYVGGGQVRLSWAAPPCCDGVLGDAATEYWVYHSTDGRAFDNGTAAGGTSVTLPGLAPGSLHFFRVTAANGGGESFPTPLVAVRIPDAGSTADLLIVDGFDRLDQDALVPQWESPYLGTARLMFLERMNRYDYAVEHALALAACGVSFDGAVNEAVAAGDVALASYRALDWLTGEDSTADAALDAAERGARAAYLDGGGRLLLSGADVAYDLGGQGRDPAFLRDYLKAGYAGDEGAGSEFGGLEGGPFAGLSGILDDGTGNTYRVDAPDRLSAAADARAALTYAGGAPAGVTYDGSFRLVYLGFPFEAVAGPGARRDLACAAAGYLLGTDSPPLVERERLIDPGFEAGLDQDAWQVTAPGGQVVLHRDDLPPGVTPASGDWAAQVGGYTPGVQSTAALTQVVALPAGDPAATLSLAWRVEPVAGVPAPGDLLSVHIYDLAGTVLVTPIEIDGTALSGTWLTGTWTLPGLSGQVVQLVMRATTANTAFFVDDLGLTTAGPSGPAEFRALWVDAYHDGIKSRAQVDKLVETARAANVNALLVQVRRRGDTYYPSALEPWAPDADPAFDALAYLIEVAHGAGIEVHAWATTLAIWNTGTLPADAAHVFSVHGPGATGDDYWLMTSDSGGEAAGNVYYLDPGHPAVVDHTVRVYEELVRRYDLDGVHLDHVRYPAQNWGYNPASLARFLAATGRDDAPEGSDAEWSRWRREQVTGLVRRVYLAVTAIDPTIRVSAGLSAVSQPPVDDASWQTSDPYLHHLQDWRAWLEEGIVDLGLPMTYRAADDPLYGPQFDGWIEWQKEHQYGRGIVVGTGLYLNVLDDSIAQWQRVRLPVAGGGRALGMAGYSYATPSDDGATGRALANAVVAGVFTQTAGTPFLTWKDSPGLGHVAVRAASVAVCPAIDGMAATLAGQVTRTLQADGSGWLGAVDLPPGSYSLSLGGVQVPLVITAGQVTARTVMLPGCASHGFYLPLTVK
ncbi:MAG TPA: family 10 glycosylhydrolase [Anaerolineae bacterium]|nr:family 10 glycosylhydrolase [Anaerolineae bacterium]